MATYVIGKGKRRHREVAVDGGQRDKALRAAGKTPLEDRARDIAKASDPDDNPDN